jgi:hypothetical protein
MASNAAAGAVTIFHMCDTHVLAEPLVLEQEKVAEMRGCSPVGLGGCLVGQCYSGRTGFATRRRRRRSRA